MIARAFRAATAVLALAVSACASHAPLPLGAALVATDARPEVVDDDGRPRALAVRLCRPPAARRASPLVVINHGAPPFAEQVPIMQPTSCESEPAQWFTARGYVVVFALRRGFGASAGRIAEESGSCDAPDYVHAGLEGARDIDAVIRWAERLPGVRADATLVVGQSTGGWASLAYASRADARAVAVINMAGGRAFGEPSGYCHVERLVASAGHFGATARIPTLWIYASNDRTFPPDLATALHAAFVAAGGRAVFVETPPFAQDGHTLFYGQGGHDVWGPVIGRFLHDALEAAPGSA